MSNASPELHLHAGGEQAGVCVTIESRNGINQATLELTVRLSISINGVGWVHFPSYILVTRAEDEVGLDSE